MRQTVGVLSQIVFVLLETAHRELFESNPFLLTATLETFRREKALKSLLENKCAARPPPPPFPPRPFQNCGFTPYHSKTFGSANENIS